MSNPEKFEDENDKLAFDQSIKKPNDSMANTFKKPKGTVQRFEKEEKDENYWSNRFEALLENDDIDVDEDFYDEQVLFNEPDELLDIFEEL